ncbi:hypothetical protein CNMCM5793_008555 [Aspergillus hiratsukae]|uniref:Uncharacterized protein n=1 Tax=Aspergillus hiratsukae TaxID=1194566 RepID=A0A8H6UCB5_9EURO|nr:hypothetical protein CNMCM5793_008555 [Aspergillus hiratsukae]KAF7168550.1 hypothetical protein CNMCM6106_003688 [Aspergillus hiratsukae]
MNNNFSNNNPNYNPNSLPNLNNGMDQSFYANMPNTMQNNMNNPHNLGMNDVTARAFAATEQQHPLYCTFDFFMVFTNLPDQPWPSYNLLQQCLEKVRARDARVYSSVDAIQRYGGAKTGDLILSFTAAAMTEGVIWTSAEEVILHQMRYWDRDRRLAGWGLVAAHGLAQ